MVPPIAPRPGRGVIEPVMIRSFLHRPVALHLPTLRISRTPIHVSTRLVASHDALLLWLVAHPWSAMHNGDGSIAAKQ